MLTIKQDLANPTNYRKGRTRPIEYIVFHYDANNGATDENNGNYFENDANLNASANYFVDEDSATCSVKDTDTAWHCGSESGRYVHPDCRNANSLGIEICSERDTNGNYYFTEATIANAVELGRMKMAEHGVDINHCLRHYDVTGKICPAPFVNDESKWIDFKTRLMKRMGEEMQVGMNIQEVKVAMNGNQVEKSTVLKVDGRDTTYIPAVALRAVGINVTWDAASNTVVITK